MAESGCRRTVPAPFSPGPPIMPVMSICDARPAGALDTGHRRATFGVASQARLRVRGKG